MEGIEMYFAKICLICKISPMYILYSYRQRMAVWLYYNECSTYHNMTHTFSEKLKPVHVHPLFWGTYIINNICIYIYSFIIILHCCIKLT